MHFLIDMYYAKSNGKIGCFVFIWDKPGVGGILPVVLIAPNNRQSANSNQLRRQANFPQDSKLFLKTAIFFSTGKMNEDEEHTPLWGERLRKEVEETQGLEMVLQC